MRTRTLCIMLLALGCGGEEEAAEPEAAEGAPEAIEATAEAPEAVASEPISLAAVPSYFGGAKIVAGSFAVELFPSSDGTLKAFVSKEDGSAVAGADLKVEMQGSDGQAHEVTLAWDASANAYISMMDDAKPSPGPLTVMVEADGTTGQSVDATINVASTPLYGGNIVLLGDVAAEVVADPGGAVLVSAQGPGGVLTEDAVELTVAVQGDDGDKYDLPLAWDADANVYAGLLPDEVHVAPGALEVQASVDGVEYSAGIPEIAVALPEHGGDIIAAGDHTVELVAESDGSLQAFVRDAAGEPVAGTAEIALALPGAPTLDLVWNTDKDAYVTMVPVEVDVSVAPLDVVIVREGRRRRGGIAVPAGRALGVAWRARVASGQGGAIPPGQARRLQLDVDLRGRLSGRGRGRGRGLGMGMGRGRRGNAMGMAPMIDVQVDVSGVNAAGARARGAAAAVKARLRGPMAPMVSIMAGASAMGMGMGRRGSAMGGASVMISF